MPPSGQHRVPQLVESLCLRDDEHAATITKQQKACNELQRRLRETGQAPQLHKAGVHKHLLKLVRWDGCDEGVKDTALGVLGDMADSSECPDVSQWLGEHGLMDTLATMVKDAEETGVVAATRCVAKLLRHPGTGNSRRLVKCELLQLLMQDLESRGGDAAEWVWRAAARAVAADAECADELLAAGVDKLLELVWCDDAPGEGTYPCTEEQQVTRCKLALWVAGNLAVSASAAETVRSGDFPEDLARLLESARMCPSMRARDEGDSDVPQSATCLALWVVEQMARAAHSAKAAFECEELCDAVILLLTNRYRTAEEARLVCLAVAELAEDDGNNGRMQDEYNTVVEVLRWHRAAMKDEDIVQVLQNLADNLENAEILGEHGACELVVGVAERHGQWRLCAADHKHAEHGIFVGTWNAILNLADCDRNIAKLSAAGAGEEARLALIDATTVLSAADVDVELQQQAAEIAEVACKAVAALAGNSKVSAAIADAGICEPVVAALRVAAATAAVRATIQPAALAAVAALSCGAPNPLLLACEGLVVLLTSAAEDADSSVEVQAHAWAALAHLCASVSERCRQQLRGARACNRITLALQTHRGHMEVLQWVVCALRNLCADGAAVALLCEAGALPCAQELARQWATPTEAAAPPKHAVANLDAAVERMAPVAARQAAECEAARLRAKLAAAGAREKELLAQVAALRQRQREHEAEAVAAAALRGELAATCAREEELQAQVAGLQQRQREHEAEAAAAAVLRQTELLQWRQQAQQGQQRLQRLEEQLAGARADVAAGQEESGRLKQLWHSAVAAHAVAGAEWAAERERLAAEHAGQLARLAAEHTRAAAVQRARVLAALEGPESDAAADADVKEVKPAPASGSDGVLAVGGGAAEEAEVGAKRKRDGALAA